MVKGGSAETPTPASWNELFKIPEVRLADVMIIPASHAEHLLALSEQQDISWRQPPEATWCLTLCWDISLTKEHRMLPALQTGVALDEGSLQLIWHVGYLPAQPACQLAMILTLGSFSQHERAMSGSAVGRCLHLSILSSPWHTCHLSYLPKSELSQGAPEGRKRVVRRLVYEQKPMLMDAPLLYQWPAFLLWQGLSLPIPSRRASCTVAGSLRSVCM